MTGARAIAASPVAWLSAQAILFGAMAAILGVVANAMFLKAYGSAWLPVTYIVIGVAGVVTSAAIRRGAQRFDLLRLAVAVLGGAGILFALSWLIATRSGGAWVSGPLLVIFPILIQLGFVFVGGQAGRVLDIAGIKGSFPRIMAGFPVGATLGGLAAVPIVDRLGRVEDLLFVTAVVQGAFAALVWATGRRFAPLLDHLPPAPEAAATDDEHDRAGVSLRALVGRPFIALVLVYQVLSALGSQIADYLVFDRASVLLPGEEDLGRFLAQYTAVMNGVAIAFLALLAGPLLRRHGLRLGVGANPVVDLVLALSILAVLVVSGPASIALLGIVSAARIADIALTDGMTRTSINALYQVLPARQRLAAQATVEGMGVPLAIGASGVLILLLNELPIALAARVVMLAVVCAAWAWVALRLYREYAPALADALRSRRLLDPDAPIGASPADLAALSRLAAGADANAARLAQDLAAAVRGEQHEAVAVPFGARAIPGRRPSQLDEGALAGLAATLDTAAGPAATAGDGLTAARMVRALRTPSPARDELLAAHAGVPDRALGLVILERLAASRPASTAGRAGLDAVVGDGIDGAGRTLAAMAAIEADPEVDPDGAVVRALSDELDLHRRRVVAALAARYGRDELGSALSRLRRPGEFTSASESALAAEALEVALGRDRSMQVVAVLTPGLPPGERMRRLGGPSPHPRGLETTGPSGEDSSRAWLLDIATDAAARWRSPWLRACSIRALRLAAPTDGRPLASLAAGGSAADPLVAEELALLRLHLQPARSRDRSTASGRPRERGPTRR